MKLNKDTQVLIKLTLFNILIVLIISSLFIGLLYYMFLVIDLYNYIKYNDVPYSVRDTIIMFIVTFVCVCLSLVVVLLKNVLKWLSDYKKKKK